MTAPHHNTQSGRGDFSKTALKTPLILVLLKLQKLKY